MKKYKVKVNGKTYNVLLEAVEEVNGNIAVENKSIKVEHPIIESDEGKDVVSPIQGNILNILVICTFVYIYISYYSPWLSL